MADLMFLMLAQVEAPMPPVTPDGGFFAVWKIVVMALLMFVWAWPAGWVCRDARRLSINEFMWGMVVAAAGVVGWFCWVVFPSYWLGLLFFVLLGLGGLLAYALYRDSLVGEEDKILKPANLLSAIRGEQEQTFEIKTKVRLSTYEGREAKIPEGEELQKIYQAFQDMLFDALWRRSSDILVQPTGEHYRVLFKIDGVGAEYGMLDRKMGQMIVDYAKGTCGLEINERRRPQRAKLIAQQADVDRKVNLDIETSGSTAGERLRIRVRAEEAKFTVDDLGFTESQLAKVKELVGHKKGVVLISGLGGSGVSTTLYAFGRSHDSFQQNIHTVEAKPLMDLDNITQNIYQSGQEQSFARLLQSVSRREPDIILVDPCADAETMKMIGTIVEAKERKIVAAIRGSNALSALGRAIRWMENPATAAATLSAVTFQRLIRKLCPTCREAYKPNPETLRKLNLASKSDVVFFRPPTQEVVDKKGNPVVCGTCQGTGYLGRTAVLELLVVDDQLREAIRSGDANKIKSAVRKAGLSYWQEVAMEQVVAGVTSVQEIVRVSKEAETAEKTR